MQKDLRKGKVLVDWSQNDIQKTTINVYSLRAKEHPTVSTPIPWDKVETSVKRKSGGCLNFEAADLIKRLEKRGDLFAPRPQFEATIAQVTMRSPQNIRPLVRVATFRPAPAHVRSRHGFKMLGRVNTP
jgi:DNA primase